MSRASNRLQSTSVDAARRLLLPSSDDARLSQLSVGIKEASRPLVALRYDNIAGLPWRDRMRHWVRWTAGVAKDSHKTSGSSSGALSKEVPVNEAMKKMAMSVNRKQLSPADKALHPGQIQDYIRWEDQTFTTSSIVLGHILHESDGQAPIAAPLANASTVKGTKFLPTTQNLAQLLSDNELTTTEPQASVRMRFVPSPWTSTGPKATRTFPPVDMRFSINEETKQLELEDVVAVMQSTASDVMLPDCALDLRFRQSITCRLRTLHSNQLESIKDFLLASQLNITNGPLVTPSSLTIPISRHMFKHDDDTNIEAPASVEYLFAGLEYRKTFSTAFDGWKLMYASIEGGKAEGRRTELSLRPTRVNTNENLARSSPQSYKERSADRFIEAAYKLVDALEETESNVRQVEHGPESIRLVQLLNGSSKKDSGTEFGHFQIPVFKASNWLDNEDLKVLDEQMKAEEAQEQSKLEAHPDVATDVAQEGRGLPASAAWIQSTPDDSNGENRT